MIDILIKILIEILIYFVIMLKKKELVNKIQIDIIDKDKKIKPEKINSNIVSVFKKKIYGRFFATGIDKHFS